MTSVRSHRLQSSGNKWFVFLLIGLILGACSPKIRPENTPHKAAEVKKQPQPVVIPKIVAPKVSSIALMLPFNLDQLDLSVNASYANLSKADLAIEYYQGFKFALDSLTAKGYNYKLQVFDSKDTAPQARALAINAKIRSSDLIVGPVFPESVTAFTSSFTANKIVVSPLSPAPPAEFKSNKLVTVIPPLEYHAWAAAQYIDSRIKPKKVFILKSGYSDENKYIIPFHKAIDSLGKKKITVTSLLVTHGNLDALLPQLSTTDENVFIVPATDELFLIVTLRSLQKLAQTYPVTVFGHPNWTKLNFLKPDLLQDIKTHITTADNIDYKSPVTISFVKNYKKIYHTEPSEYAIKGFDEGYYFGTLVNAGADSLAHLDKAGYKGLYNQFNFIKTPNYGWVNTHVTILQYQNFELKKVE
jgi:ABC-type branched-subunit amino acid transport system substrate-binding protein